MNLPLKLVVLTLVVNCFFIGYTAGGSTGKINDYLVKNCDQLDFKSNLKVAQQYLSSLSVKPSFFTHSLVEDLKTFISLGRVESGEVQCSSESRKILDANNKIAGDLIKRVQKKGTYFMTRYNSLIWDVFQKHAKNCLVAYQTRYDRLKNTNKENVSMVETITKMIVYSYWSDKVPKLLDDDDAKHVQDALVELVQKYNDPDRMYASLINDEATGKGILHDTKYKTLYEKYIKQPCVDYIKQFGPNLLEPAEFDFGIHHDMQEEVLQYKICNRITGFYAKLFQFEVMNNARMYIYKIK